jgi:hypothetical protein
MLLAHVSEAAAALEPVSLAEIGRAALLDRTDTKFTVPATRIPDLIRRCERDYRVLEVAGERLSRYRTVYYDTSELVFYHAHHAGHFPRYKVRVRSYEDTGIRFAEVKRKTNTARTVKSRAEIGRGAPRALDALWSVVEPEHRVADVFDLLRETATVSFRRITLVHRAIAERVTIDTMIGCEADGRRADFPGLAVVEVKRAIRAPSHLAGELAALHVRAATISKYCLAIASLDERAKKNRFKAILRRLDKYHLSDHDHPGH